MNDGRIVSRYIGAFTDFLINISVILVAFKIAYENSFIVMTENSVIVGTLIVFLASFIYFLSDMYSLKRHERLINILVKAFIAQLFVLMFSMVAVALFTSRVASNYVFTIILCGISYACIAVKKIIVTKILHKIRINKKKSKTYYYRR